MVGGAGRARCRCCRAAPPMPAALAECADEIIARLAQGQVAGHHRGRRNPPLRHRGAHHRAGAQAQTCGGHHIHGPRPARGCLGRRCSAPISVPRVRPTSARWSTKAVLPLLLGVIQSDTNFALSQQNHNAPANSVLALDRDRAHRSPHLFQCSARRSGRGAAEESPGRSAARRGAP